MRLRCLDVLALLMSLGAAGSMSGFAYARVGKAPEVVIDAAGDRWIYPLGEDRQVTVTGPLGAEVITIRGGQAYVESSPCPNKLCVLQGRISRPGQWIACLPNRVFISIEGKTDGDLDATSY
jgi:hypothetical protein